MAHEVTSISTNVNTNAALRWEYPVKAHFYSAMAVLASSEHNVKHFLDRALKYPGVGTYHLVEHNLKLLADAQATAISWASRD